LLIESKFDINLEFKMIPLILYLHLIATIRLSRSFQNGGASKTLPSISPSRNALV
jgi:hypothetical protein